MKQSLPATWIKYMDVNQRKVFVWEFLLKNPTQRRHWAGKLLEYTLYILNESISRVTRDFVHISHQARLLFRFTKRKEFLSIFPIHINRQMKMFPSSSSSIFRVTLSQFFLPFWRVNAKSIKSFVISCKLRLFHKKQGEKQINLINWSSHPTMRR